MAVAAILAGPADFAGWRQAARGLVAAGLPPAQVEWRVAGDAPSLFGTSPFGSSLAGDAPAPAQEPGRFTVPRAFLALAEVAIRHSDPERFALLYGLLWRLQQGEAALMQVATDPAVARLEALAKAVRRDAHKMHAFLRFRQVETEAGPRHIAWFEPDHHIEEAEADFFVRRFASLRWTIVTPRRTVGWDGEALSFAPGGRRADVPPDDAVEPLWRAYYGAIFNPARVKPAAMRAEMPRKYWRNMPETFEIPRLLAEASRRVKEMVDRGAALPNPQPQRAVHVPAQPDAPSRPVPAQPATPSRPVPAQPDAPSRVEEAMDLLDTPRDPSLALAELCQELLGRGDLPDWAIRATQPVFGEGPVGAPLLFVGEQPGDEEDIQGRPFVGPAGRLFNRAMQAAGLPRDAAYVTNAVKHFKFTPTGKRRLHQSPDAGDITYYRPFLLREVGLVSPRLVVALGASALQALTGKKLPVMKTRGTTVTALDGHKVFATVHPSYLLRIPDEDGQAREFARFVEDLKAAGAQAL